LNRLDPFSVNMNDMNSKLLRFYYT
jgi:hypothetical protein